MLIVHLFQRFKPHRKSTYVVLLFCFMLVTINLFLYFILHTNSPVYLVNELSTFKTNPTNVHVPKTSTTKTIYPNGTSSFNKLHEEFSTHNYITEITCSLTPYQTKPHKHRYIRRDDLYGWITQTKRKYPLSTLPVYFADHKLHKTGKCDKYTYQKIFSVNDDISIITEEQVITDEYINDTEFVKVMCYKGDGVSNYYLSQVLRQNITVNERNSVNFVVLGFDSVSRSVYRSVLTELRDTLRDIEREKEVLVVDVENMNVIGDGTTDNIIGVLTGRLKRDLYEARREVEGAKHIDDWPWLFKDLQKHGYSTMFFEDRVYKFNMFNYRLMGWNKQPTTHYPRSYGHFYSTDKTLKRNTVNGVHILVNSLHYIENMFNVYNEDEENYNPIFSFLWDNTAHGNSDDIQIHSDLLRLLFSKWYKLYDGKAKQSNNKKGKFIKNILENDFKTDFGENTVLVLLSDHGQRFGKFRMTDMGRIDEKVPMVTLIFPRSFTKRFSKYIPNLKENAKHRMITHRDIHATIQHLVGLYNEDNDLLWSKPYHRSLLNEIPKDRQCKEAEISPHFCICSIWRFVSSSTCNTTSKSGVKAIVDMINKRVKNDPKNRCHEVFVNHILEVSYQSQNSIPSERVYQVIFTFGTKRHYHYGTLEGIFRVRCSQNEIEFIADEELLRPDGYTIGKCKASDHLRKFCDCKVDHENS